MGEHFGREERWVSERSTFKQAPITAVSGVMWAVTMCIAVGMPLPMILLPTGLTAYWQSPAGGLAPATMAARQFVTVDPSVLADHMYSAVISMSVAASVFLTQGLDG